jgi:urease accessory protein
MTDQEALLILSQWFSPAYPLGGFAYSHGLETAIAQGHIATAQELEGWLRDVLLHGTGRNDAILLRAGFGCNTAEAAFAVDAQARAFAASAERIMETTAQGAAFARTTNAIWALDVPDLTLPVAVGFAAQALKLPIKLTTQMYLQNFASTLVSAAVRLVPLGQTEGQSCLTALSPFCADIAKDSEAATLDDLFSSAFISDIMAMQHESLSPRIFQS